MLERSAQREKELAPPGATPTLDDLPRRIADFATLGEALDYAAQGQKGLNFHDARGTLTRTYSYAELRTDALGHARRFIALVGARLNVTPLQLSTPAWTRHAAAALDRVWRVGGEPPAVVARSARRVVNRTVSIEKARHLLEFEPVSLEWGLDQTAAELRARSRQALGRDGERELPARV